MIVENELYRYLVILVIFLCGSAFYSASETALSTVNKIRIKHLARNGNKDAAGILQLLDHFDEVLEYWEGIKDRADIIDAVALRDEKLGYKWPVSFDTWRQITHLQELPEEVTKPLWEKEQRVFAAVPDLGSLAERRINSINLIKKQYENE